jgi:nicotinate-nucleotide--dimethylbenzimidazole phosphoribosyltransferase
MTGPTTIKPLASPKFGELRALLRDLPEPDLELGEAARRRQDVLTKPKGSLGRLEELAIWLAGWQGREKPELDRPRCLIFAGNHGVAARGVSAYPSEVTAQMVLNFEAGGAAINQLCDRFGIALRVIPLDLDRPTADFTQAPALSVAEFDAAFQVGFESVVSDTSVLLLGEMGIGNTTAAAAICTALFGGPAAAWVGPGTGVDHDGLANKRAVIESAVSRHRALLENPLEILRVLGGRELVAIAGATMAARQMRIPVLLDGFISTAAVAPLQSAWRAALAHCTASHVSAEPGHRKLLDELGMEPVLGLRMRLGEASGAAVAFAVLAAAVACHNGMATFEEAGVSKKS